MNKSWFANSSGKQTQKTSNELVWALWRDMKDTVPTATSKVDVSCDASTKATFHDKPFQDSRFSSYITIWMTQQFWTQHKSEWMGTVMAEMQKAKHLGSWWQQVELKWWKCGLKDGCYKTERLRTTENGLLNHTMYPPTCTSRNMW